MDCCTAAIALARHSRSGPTANGDPWSGPGCPGRCRERALDGPTLRAAIGAGRETWMDTAVGPCAGEVAPAGDPPIRDRDGNWTYPFSVVVDDLRQDIDHVIRGRDLIHATPTQIRLGRLLGRERQPTFLHHPLIRRAGRIEALEVGRATPGSESCAPPARLARRSSRPRRRPPAGARCEPAVSLESAPPTRSSISQAWSRACQAIRRAA